MVEIEWFSFFTRSNYCLLLSLGRRASFERNCAPRANEKSNAAAAERKGVLVNFLRRMSLLSPVLIWWQEIDLRQRDFDFLIM